MVQQTDADDHSPPSTTSSAKEHPISSQQGRIVSPTVAETSPDGMQAIRTTIQNQGISKEAADIILKSWRPGTCKQYQPYITQWIQHCHQRSLDPTNPTVGQALEFLLQLFKKEFRLQCPEHSTVCIVMHYCTCKYGFIWGPTTSDKISQGCL